MVMRFQSPLVYIVYIVFVMNNLRLCCQIMSTFIVIIYESVIICMYVRQKTVQFTSIKYMYCSVLFFNYNIWRNIEVMTMTMTMDLFQLRAHEGQKIIGEILHTMIEHN